MMRLPPSVALPTCQHMTELGLLARAGPFQRMHARAIFFLLNDLHRWHWEDLVLSAPEGRIWGLSGTTRLPVCGGRRYLSMPVGCDRQETWELSELHLHTYHGAPWVCSGTVLLMSSIGFGDWCMRQVSVPETLTVGLSKGCKPRSIKDILTAGIFSVLWLRCKRKLKHLQWWPPDRSWVTYQKSMCYNKTA